MSDEYSLPTPPITPRKTPTIAAFNVLALSPPSNRTEIRKAYHRRSIETHPDKTGSAETARDFRRIQEAYEILMWKLEQEEKERIARLRVVVETIDQQAVQHQAQLLQDRVVLAAFWTYCYFIPPAIVVVMVAQVLLMLQPIDIGTSVLSSAGMTISSLVGKTIFRAAIAGACLVVVGQIVGYRLSRLIVARHT